jgi:hypothetical protein
MNPSLRCFSVLVLLVSGTLVCTTGRAEIISDNLPQARSGFQVLGTDTGENAELAQAFTTTANSTITTVTVNLSMSAANSFLRIYDDNADKPGSPVATIATGVHALADPFTQNNVFSSLAIGLAADTKYWLVMGGSTGGWGFNNPNTGTGAGYLPNNALWKVGNATWSSSVTSEPYRLKIEAVPEPAGLAIASGALMFFAWTIARQRVARIR